jgi:hypothetical protein
MMTIDKIVGVFVGEWGTSVYSILYGEEGVEYLCSRNDDRDWMIVSVKDTDGNEMVLADPMQAPDPLDVARNFVEDDDEEMLI